MLNTKVDHATIANTRERLGDTPTIEAGYQGGKFTIHSSQLTVKKTMKAQLRTTENGRRMALPSGA
jgi:hypothetical protein